MHKEIFLLSLTILDVKIDDFYMVCFCMVSSMMHSPEVSVRQTTKRKQPSSTEVADPPPQSSKAQKEWSYIFSSSSLNFWDHLSRIWLTRSAIQEFDRRTVQLVVPKPKLPSDFKGHPTKELKRFARQGGPSLCNLRGVGYLNLCL